MTYTTRMLDLIEKQAEENLKKKTFKTLITRKKISFNDLSSERVYNLQCNEVSRLNK